MWTGGMGVGVATVRREPVLGLKRIILPASYWRTMEFAYVCRQLDLPRGARVLDVGSPKDLAMILARRRGYAVTATDLLAEPVELARRYARAQGIDGDGAGRVRSEVQDGRRLGYPDDSFDAAFAVSVVEHIPGDGDTDAMREMVRVVKPGGRIVVTTPYDLVYREDSVPGSFSGKPEEAMIWERHYDDAALRSRLLSIPGSRQVGLELWGETFLRGERALGRLGRWRTVVSPLEAGLSALALRRLEPGRGQPMAAFLTLEKV